MYEPEALIDLHERTHRSLGGLMDHCGGFEDAALGHRLEGFGYPTILEQIQHVIGAERYWIGVLQGRLLVDEDDADRRSLATLEAFRQRVAHATRAFLSAATREALSTPRRVTTFGGREVEVVPAHAVLRTQTHIFQHQGQVAAMARLLGRPVGPGLDFPLS